MIDTAIIDDLFDAPTGLELALELAGLERASWRTKLSELRASGVPLNADDDDTTDDTDDADTDDTDDDTDDADKDKKKDDDDDSELAKARRALTAFKNENR